MAEASDRHGKMIDAALRIYRPAMRRYITDTLNEALGDDWYEEWLEQRLDPQRDQPQLPKGARPRYEEKQRRIRELKLDPFWLIEVRDFDDLIKTRAGDFPTKIRDQTGTMGKIAKSSEPRARQQVDRILENCNTVLQAVDGDAAKQIQQLIESGEPGTPWEADIGALPRESEPREVIDEILGQYRTAMQRYIGAKLYGAHKDRTGDSEWFTPLVLSHWPKGERKRIEADRKAGDQPTDFIDVGNIPPIINNNPQDFPMSSATVRTITCSVGLVKRETNTSPTQAREGELPGTVPKKWPVHV